MDPMYIPFRLFLVLTMWIAATWTNQKWRDFCPEVEFCGGIWQLGGQRTVSQLYLFTTFSHLKQQRNTCSSKMPRIIEPIEMLFLLSCMQNSIFCWDSLLLCIHHLPWFECRELRSGIGHGAPSLEELGLFQGLYTYNVQPRSLR